MHIYSSLKSYCAMTAAFTVELENIPDFHLEKYFVVIEHLWYAACHFSKWRGTNSWFLAVTCLCFSFISNFYWFIPGLIIDANISPIFFLSQAGKKCMAVNNPYNGLWSPNSSESIRYPPGVPECWISHLDLWINRCVQSHTGRKLLLDTSEEAHGHCLF